MKQPLKYLLIVCGFLFVGLGFLGAFLPLLPTTPFLLLAAACFARSSERFHTWLLNNRLTGEYIRNYRQNGGMRPRHKVVSIVTLWLAIGYTVLFAVQAWWLQGLLLAIACGVTFHLLRLKSVQPSSRSA